MKNKPSILEETIKATYNPEAYSAQVNKGLEQVVEGGRISMTLAAKQNAFFVDAITKALSGSLMPNPFGFSFGGQALEEYVAIQKNMMEMAMGQSAAVFEAILETGKAAEQVTSEFSNKVQQSLTAAQKEIMDMTVNPKNSSTSKVQPIREK